MSRAVKSVVSGLLSVSWACLTCALGAAPAAKPPTIQQAQAVPATGPKARIAVAQFINNTGGLEAQVQRITADTQAQMANLSRDMLEFQKKMVPYQQALAVWQAKVAQVGQEKAGPPPEAPVFESSGSGYTSTVSDPVAGGIRDMMINALFNCGRFIVLERGAINAVRWEQEFSNSGRVGSETKIPVGQIEGAELLLIGSLNTLEGESSGGAASTLLSTLAGNLEGKALGDAELAVSWKSARAAMEIRLVDARTSRVVAVTTVEGKATSVSASGAKPSSSPDNSGPLPASFSAFKNTPVEAAFRKMVNAAVQYLVTKTPENYFHTPPAESPAPPPSGGK